LIEDKERRLVRSGKGIGIWPPDWFVNLGGGVYYGKQGSGGALEVGWGSPERRDMHGVGSQSRLNLGVVADLRGGGLQVCEKDGPRTSGLWPQSSCNRWEPPPVRGKTSSAPRGAGPLRKSGLVKGRGKGVSSVHL